MSSVIKLRNNLILWTISAYLLLNYGFMIVRFPPLQGGGVPIGEMVLLFSLATMHFPTVLAELKKVFNPAPLLIFSLFGIFGALRGLPSHGMWAIRDATHEIESLYLLVGFAFAGRIEWMNKLFRWLPAIVIATVVIGLTYPIRSYVEPLAPHLTNALGDRIPLLQYLNTYIMSLWGVAMLVIWEKDINVFNYILLAGALISFLIFVHQSRTIYLQVAGLMLLMAWKKPSVNRKLLMALALFIVALMIISVTGIEITGRLGEKINFHFLLDHLKAVLGIKSDSESLNGAAAGVGLRVGWWINIFHGLTSSFGHFVTGLGFGIPLTDFHDASDALVREPHNSYISVAARMGLIGVISLIWMYASLISAWNRAYKRCVAIGWEEGKRILLFFFSYFVLLWIFSITEDGMEKPYNAISFYFFWGVVLRFALYLKNGDIGPDSEQPRPVEHSS